MDTRLFRVMVSHVLTLLLLAGTAGCAARWNCEVDAANDVGIGLLSRVIVTSQVAGTIYPVGADEWLITNDPKLYIWRHPYGEAVKVSVDVETGRFSVSLPEGRYCFRASAKSFNSLIGRIEVRQSAPSRFLDLRLSVAN